MVKARRVTHLVEEQTRRWVLQQEERKRREKLETAPALEPWPVITISREYCAKGSTLARAISERTGYSVWDKELVHAVAQETGANETIVSSLDETRRNAIENVIQGALMGIAYTNREYVEALMRITHTVGAHGSSIIVGRGAHYILAPETILRVRMVAPVDDRVRYHAERTGLDEREAYQSLQKAEEERTNFVRKHFKRDGAEASDYDLSINSSTIPTERAVDLVLLAYEIKFGRRPESMG